MSMGHCESLLDVLVRAALFESAVDEVNCKALADYLSENGREDEAALLRAKRPVMPESAQADESLVTGSEQLVPARVWVVFVIANDQSSAGLPSAGEITEGAAALRRGTLREEEGRVFVESDHDDQRYGPTDMGRPITLDRRVWRQLALLARSQGWAIDGRAVEP